eukprot:11882465-Alexandrium_andersonii.AAC.1
MAQRLLLAVLRPRARVRRPPWPSTGATASPLRPLPPRGRAAASGSGPRKARRAKARSMESQQR